MEALQSLWSRITGILSGTAIESIALLLTRIALGLIFWRSYETKIVDGTWLEIDPTQYIIFANEFTGLPLSPDLAVPMTVLLQDDEGLRRYAPFEHAAALYLPQTMQLPSDLAVQQLVVGNLLSPVHGAIQLAKTSWAPCMGCAGQPRGRGPQAMC